MKNVQLTILLLFISFNDFAQIFVNGEYNYHITIQPTGISGAGELLSSTDTGFGKGTLQAAGNISSNTAVGYSALVFPTNSFFFNYHGKNNTAVGRFALMNNKEGYNNSAFGSDVMGKMVDGYITGTRNAAFGGAALYNIKTGHNNTAFGSGTLYRNESGNNNTAFGTGAGYEIKEGNYLAAFGHNSLRYHVSGNYATAFGYYALGNDKTGIDNAAFGELSMYLNDSGSANTALGANSLYFNTTGNSNTALGAAALFESNGDDNIAVGSSVLRLNATGSKNVSVGYFSLYNNTTGMRNVAIGLHAGYGEIVDASDKLMISSKEFDNYTTLIGGDFAANKVCIGCMMSDNGTNNFNSRTEAFQVNGNAFKTAGSGNWVIPSDRRLKTDIVALHSEEILQKVLQMQGVSYTLIASPEEGAQYGFIAQDLQKVFPAKVYENKAGYLSASYGGFTPFFVEALKALNERIETLEQDQQEIKAITARLHELEGRNK